MTQETRRRGYLATAEGVKKLKDAKSKKGYTYQQIADTAHVELDSVKRLFNPHWGKGKYRIGEEYVEAIANVLELNPADIVEGWYPPANASETEQPLSETAENFKLNYRQICEKILREKINKLTTTPLTNNDGATLNLDDVYVPLGLVEPKQKPGKGGDISAEMGGQFYQYADYEVTRKFENNQFFDEVIAKGETPKSQGRKIAIVGEPGAGKTTLLQKIAFKNPDDSVAIWISLAELKGKTVEEYLLQVWLKSALKVTRVTPDLEDALVELFNEGKVWLLLDGVDEMGVNNSLGAIASQISGWVASARIILTCRLNVWDAGKNDLYSFDVYRNLDFNEGQIEEFISKWFVNKLESGKRLLTELEKPGKERIKDLMKNPLRLTMLCWFWQRREGSLPETKAQLYQRFVEVFYDLKDWQPHPFPTKSDAQKALEKAFGELAKKAIDKSSSRFRLTHRQVCDVLGEPDEPLFDLAKRLGWLNLVGVAEENKDEPVYAFFHPTFQEYFAALNIDDWDFFLPREHNNSNPQPVNGKKYRIFDAQWKEVILLWLGREDVEKEDKEEFIKKLVEFKDGCSDENFYGYRAFFLAAAGIAEFKSCTEANSIIKTIVRWSCGGFDTEKQNWLMFLRQIQVGARSALLETHSTQAIDILLDLAQEYQNLLKKYQKEKLIINGELEHHFFRDNLAYFLLEIGFCNSNAIDAVAELIRQDNGEITELISEYLGKPSPSSLVLTNAIIELIRNMLSRNDSVSIELLALGRLEPGNPIAINFLVDFICDNLSYLEPNKILSINKKFNGSLYYYAIKSLYQLDPNNPIIIPNLTKLFYSNEMGDAFEPALKFLAVTSEENSLVFNQLTNLIALPPFEEFPIWVANILARNEDDYKPRYELEEDEYFTKFSSYFAEYDLLFPKFSPSFVNEFKNILINKLTELIKNSKDTSTITEAAIALIKIDNDNNFVIPVIAKSIQYLKDDRFIFQQAVKVLAEIPEYHQTVIPILIEIIKNSQNNYHRTWAESILRKIALNNFTAVKAIEELTRNHYIVPITSKVAEGIIKFIQSNHDEKSIMIVADSLAVMSQFEPLLINSVTNNLIDRSGNKNFCATRVIEKLKECTSSNLTNSDCNSEKYARQMWKMCQEEPLSFFYFLLGYVDEQKNEYRQIKLAEKLGKFDQINSIAVVALVKLIQYSQNPTMVDFLGPGSAAYSLLKILRKDSFIEVVNSLKYYLSDRIYESNRQQFLDCYEIIWHCAQNMTYPEFYYAWHNDSIQTLEKQVVDILSQLQPTDKAHPIPIDAYPLENETDKEEIAQEICNQIYQQLFPENDNIPTVNNASQLKRLIPQIKTHLNAQNIAFILQNCEPNPSLIKFCHKLTNAVSIACLTDAPLEPPLRGFPPNQPNLKSALETWLNELE